MDNHSDPSIVSKKIIHVDMDAFYASVEQLDFPEWRGKPIAVGGSKERGVVATASYEARKFGVRSAMASSIAARMCPELIFVPPRFSRYKEISNQVSDIFFEFTELVEPLSLDEAYLDVTARAGTLDAAVQIAEEIREKIKKGTGLTASAGVSYNKFLAKTASELRKPDGLSVIREDEADEFLRKLPIGKFFGIGAATADKLKKAGIFTGADLRKKSKQDLILRFGKSGSYYYNICRGIDHRQVQPDRERKSISVETTFDQDIRYWEEAVEQLKELAKEGFRRYQRHGIPGKTITIKVKYSDFTQITRSVTHDQPIQTLEGFSDAAGTLLTPEVVEKAGIRLLGVGIHNFLTDDTSPDPQLQIEF